MEMVQVAVDRGIQQLGASAGPTANGAPGDSYVMPARTREDVIQQSPGIIAAPADIAAPNNAQLVQQGMQLRPEESDMFAVLSRAADPAVQQLGHGVPNQAPMQPMREAPVSQSGLVLPPGMPPQEVQDEGTGAGHDDGPLRWLL